MQHDGMSSISIYVASSTYYITYVCTYIRYALYVVSFFGYFNFQDQVTKPIFFTYAQISKQDILQFYIPGWYMWWGECVLCTFIYSF